MISSCRESRERKAPIRKSITKNEMRFIGPEDGCPEENLQHNQAPRIFGTHPATTRRNRPRIIDFRTSSIADGSLHDPSINQDPKPDETFGRDRRLHPPLPRAPSINVTKPPVSSEPKVRALSDLIDPFDRDDFTSWLGAHRTAMRGIGEDVQRRHDVKTPGLRWGSSAPRGRCGPRPMRHIALRPTSTLKTDEHPSN